MTRPRLLKRLPRPTLCNCTQVREGFVFGRKSVMPTKANGKPDASSVAGKLSDKYAGKLSAEVAEALQQHLAESRSEWERI